MISLNIVQCPMNRIRSRKWLLLIKVAILISEIGAATTQQKLVAGGRLVEEDDANWQVAVIHKKKITCSGSLLRGNVVLTAAVCIQNAELDDVRIRAGSKTFKKGGQIRRILRATYHSQYQADKHTHNIALLELVKPFDSTVNNISSIRMPSSIHGDLPSSVFVYGWGISSLATKQALSKQLRVSRYKVYSDKTCAHYLKEEHSNSLENVFCIGDRTKQVDLCVDDIGGPAVSQTGVQQGVVSYGGICSSDNTLILTNVSTHLPWIEKVLSGWSQTKPRITLSLF